MTSDPTAPIRHKPGPRVPPAVVQAASFRQVCACRAIYVAGTPDPELLASWQAAHADHQDGHPHA